VITYAGVTIFSKDADGYGIGVELSHLIDGKYEPYAILSLWALKSDYPSKWQLLPYIFAEALKIVKKGDKGIVISSTERYFTTSKQRVFLKAGVFAGGKEIRIRYLKHAPGATLALAIDAVYRKTNIIEEL
jgi:hypothetical protein